jgi:hypothetical protein
MRSYCDNASLCFLRLDYECDNFLYWADGASSFRLFSRLSPVSLISTLDTSGFITTLVLVGEMFAFSCEWQVQKSLYEPLLSPFEMNPRRYSSLKVNHNASMFQKS